jgi:hypothetical protein
VANGIQRSYNNPVSIQLATGDNFILSNDTRQLYCKYGKNSKPENDIQKTSLWISDGYGS